MHPDDKPKICSKESRHANTSLHPIRVHDMRPVIDRLSLEANGFCVLRHTPSVDPDRWMDREHVHEIYYPAMAEVVKEVTGCQWVSVPPGKFGHVRIAIYMPTFVYWKCSGSRELTLKNDDFPIEKCH